MMKKLTALILTLVMSLSILSGCASDPVEEELLQFINVDMQEVIAKRRDLINELEAWEDLTDEEIMVHIEDIIWPNIEQALAMLDEIRPKTEQVRALKDKNKKAWEKAQEAFEILWLAGLSMQNETLPSLAEYKMMQDTMNEASNLFDEYEQALQDLAAEKNIELEYFD